MRTLCARLVADSKTPTQQFLPRDASAERGIATVSRLSVCPSVRDV